METTPKYILKFGIGITFFVTGFLILLNPEGWALMIKPWALELLPVPAVSVMVTTAYFDMLLGIWLMIEWKSWISYALASLHLAMVLAVSGIDEVTYRDIGLLAATLALLISGKLPAKKKPEPFPTA
ncbi:MAG TPA: hypothetical protein DCX32_03125 [Candidatus Moranbacteria bacterium]|nr:MAG: hypothetical protein UW87_C0003G0016 [Candidatus Moranbacteria bacterium GW2011_GWC2_45_10]KKT95039.1 MAG: hypothetical protein UW95_C0005G0026 [Parcubacteria group bacterium GW2011_GWC1_45_14]HAV11511.1 hypothetical protein [Candidatus Moranbacteria bacterium]